MQGKSLVLTLDDKDLQVSVHPEFPKQPLTIAVELSDQQLSEYLLKPILSSAAIN
jgi:hypothetical protein